MLPALSSISTRSEMWPLQQRLGSWFTTLAIDWVGFGDHGRVRGRDAPEIPHGDGSFGGFAQCCGYYRPPCKLAVHEEFPDQVAATVKNFLLAA